MRGGDGLPFGAVARCRWIYVAPLTKLLQKVAGVRQVPACLSRRIYLRSTYVFAYRVLRIGRLAWAVGDFWP
jgi:hypothetical protein